MQYAIQVLRYAGPLTVLLYYLVAAVVSICTLQSLKKPNDRRSHKSAVYYMLCVITTYLGEASMLVYNTFKGQPYTSTTDSKVYTISSVLVWLILIIFLRASENPVWYPYHGSWSFGLILEILLSSLSFAICQPSSPFDYTLLGIRTFRLLVLTLLVFLSFDSLSKAVFPRSVPANEEQTPLFKQTGHTKVDDETSGTAYGSMTMEATSSDDASLEVDTEQDEDDEGIRKVEERLKATGNWFAYAREFTIFLPYVWPSSSKDRTLQLNMLGVVVCLACIRALNVLVPRQLGLVINALGVPRNNLPLQEIGVYIIYNLAAYTAGFPFIKDWLWLPVEQYSLKSINAASYNHIMSLSCDFHDNKKSGELYRSIEQGKSIGGLLETLLFELLPMLIDLVVAYAYLYYLFDTYMALTVAATSIMYLWAAMYYNQKQNILQRSWTDIWRKDYQHVYDTLGNWTTITYFNRLSYECERYSSIVEQEMRSQKELYHVYYLAYAVQSVALEAGFFGACLIAAYQIVNGRKSVGDFATLATYWSQFTGPLSFFGSAQRQLQTSLINAERLLQLFQTTPTVKDGQEVLKIKEGAVSFKNIRFSYDGKKEVTKDISFDAKPGQKIALVGETGGGKSTILKLLLRLYDVSHGSISIDGQDILGVTLASLRDSIGVVPQDPSLFNDTIMTNVRYARIEATDKEVKAACQAAAVHDKIMTFTDGYASKVGEKGVKLSGGELQRIAIARAILKNPRIMLLDEATSSVDTETEGLIQKALEKLTQGRTTFIVAHRLSTVMNADLMLVIKDGEIVERGAPKELLKAKGKYYDLWSKQNGIISSPHDADVELGEHPTSSNKGRTQDEQREL